MSLLDFGTHTTPRQSVNLTRDDMHVRTLSAVLTTVEPFVVTLLTLLPRPVLPDMVAIMKTATTMNNTYLVARVRLFTKEIRLVQLRPPSPKKGTAARADPKLPALRTILTLRFGARILTPLWTIILGSKHKASLITNFKFIRLTTPNPLRKFLPPPWKTPTQLLVNLSDFNYIAATNTNTTHTPRNPFSNR